MNSRHLLCSSFITHSIALLCLTISLFAAYRIHTEDDMPQLSHCTFERLLSDTVSGTNISIFAEDHPIQRSIAYEDIVKSIPQNSNIYNKIVIIADKFDYKVRQRGSFYLLTKKFSSIQDIPDVTPEECHRSFENIDKFLGKFEPTEESAGAKGYYGAAKRLFDFFDENQLDLLKDGQLRATSLTPPQQKLVAAIALKYSAEFNRNISHSIVDELYRVFNEKAKIQRAKREVPTEVIISTPKIYPGDQDSIVLPMRITQNDENVRKTDIEKIDISKQEICKEYYTLSSALLVCDGSGDSNKSISIDECLSQKHITFIGNHKISHLNFVKMVADVYGLNLDVQKEAVKLTVFPVPNSINISEMVFTARLLLPSPVVRALHLESMDRIYMKLKTPETHWKGTVYDTNVAERVLTKREREQRKQYLECPGLYYESAITNICYLLAIRESRKRAQEGDVKALNTYEKSLLANMILWKSVARMDIFYSLPPSLEAFDDLYLTGKKTTLGGKPAFEIGILSRAPQGESSISWGLTRYRIREETQ